MDPSQNKNHTITFYPNQLLQGSARPIVISCGNSKSSFQCWGCGGIHMLRDCPQINYDIKRVHNKIVGNVTKYTPRIYVALENWQAMHQSTIVEVEGVNSQTHMLKISP